jgi:hypothetical protein
MKATFLILIGIALSAGAQADTIGCEAVKKTKGNVTLRGVRVTYNGKTHVQNPLFFGGTSAEVFFGTNAGLRDRAGNLCWQVLNATRCKVGETKEWYENVGDPGFGPALYQKFSSTEGTLSVDSGKVSNDIRNRIGRELSAQHGAKFDYLSSCETARADLAFAVLESVRAEQDASRRGFEYEPVKMYDKY